MVFGPELNGIFHHLNIYAPVFEMKPVDTIGADTYWEAEVFLLGSMAQEERVITESFEVHAPDKEQCLRIATHTTLGRIVERYSSKLKGTVYYEMTRILPTGIIWPKKFRPTP